MIIHDDLVEKILRDTDKFSVDQLKELREQSVKEKKSLQELALSSNLISDTELTKHYAEEIDVPLAEFPTGALLKNSLQLLPERIAKQYRAVPFNIDDDGVIYVAMEDPDDIQAINFLQRQLGKPIRVHIAAPSAINAALEQYSGGDVDTSELAKVIAVEDKSEEEETIAEEDVAEDSPIAQTLNLIIDYGIKVRASDVHIEPRENIVIVRYRVDGILREANKLPRKVLSALVSRIKILANLKIDEHRAPQDGRFKIVIEDHVYALRVSTLPIVDGEKVVIRILDESSKAPTLEDLGYWGESLERVERAMVQPHGLILVTGPTGSGKSTSLFSILNQLNHPEVNISTIEDPVEYRIVGVNQTQVNPLAGMTFASGLRSLLRQDPNIIMVGEVRDGETADLAVQAALTGHLVFSTLHTNNASTCLPRLLDMKIEPFLIASTVRIVIGQRLVRRLCPECRKSFKPDDGVLARIKKNFNLSSDSDFGHIHALEKQAQEAGIVAKKYGKKTDDEYATNEKTITKLWQANEQGCNNCNHTGYVGRMGIYEVLENNPTIEKSIINAATSEEIEKQAISDGMVTMHLDGFIKAIRGLTSIEEILRVTASDVE